MGPPGGGGLSHGTTGSMVNPALFVKHFGWTAACAADAAFIVYSSSQRTSGTDEPTRRRPSAELLYRTSPVASQDQHDDGSCSAALNIQLYSAFWPITYLVYYRKISISQDFRCRGGCTLLMPQIVMTSSRIMYTHCIAIRCRL